MTPEIAFLTMGLIFVGGFSVLLIYFEILDRKDERELRIAKEKRRKKKKLKYQS